MSENQYAILSISLKGFEAPDTSSQVEGRIAPGRYRVIEYKKNYPTEETDYAHLEVPALGDEETWICTRWKDHEYATIETKVIASLPGPDFRDDPMAIDEQTLVDLLPAFYPFTYDLDRARYPFEISGFRTPVMPPSTNNCCTFVEGLVAKAWENALDYQWSREKHGQMMIFSRDDYFSPVTCLLESSIAAPVENDDDAPPPWTVIQGWRKQWNGGHTFIIVGHHGNTDKVLTLESNSAYRLNGVGYRMIGNIKDHPEPPDNWWEIDGLWTWERIKSVYRYRKQGQLKVKKPQWSKL